MSYNNFFELAAALLVDILKPLKSRLNESEFRIFLAELGLALPPSVDSLPSVVNDVKSIANQIDPLIQGVEQLIEAIGNGSESDIIEKAKDIFNNVKPVFDNIENLANTLKNNAGALSGVPQSEIIAFADNLPDKIFNYLVVSNLERIGGVAEGLEFIDVIERKDHTTTFPGTSDSLMYTERIFKLNQLFNFITGPDQHLQTLYGWNTPSFNGNDLFVKIGAIFNRANVPAIYDPGTNTLDAGTLEFTTTNDTPKGIRVTFRDTIQGSQSISFDAEDWTFELGLQAQIAAALQLDILQGNQLRVTPPTGSFEGESFFEWGTKETGQPYILIGNQQESRLEISKFSSRFEVPFQASTSPPNSFTGSFRFLNSVKGGKLIIDNSNSDGFLSKILPDNIESEFEFVIGWSSETGLIFDGSSALEIDLPAHIELGPIEIQIIHLGVGIDGEGLNTSLGVTAKGELGPFAASVQNIGIKADFEYVENGGNMGPIDASLGFKFPTGVGLQLDASVIKGGGFLYIDVEKGEYAGVAELTINGTISVKAIGIINTKLPNGESGFALLLLITAEFTPIQLGFGFSLNGVGGLLGANRGMNLMAIREGVRNQTLDSVLFPDDPVANAPAIIANLGAFFPIAENNHSFGIMGIIGWGIPTLLEVELGLMITFPSFDLAILGKLSMALPDKAVPILSLNVAFAGTISFEKKYLFFDAAIYDSKLLTLSLSGQMALRILWGDEPNFVLSVGGFHPEFEPPPLELTQLERITLNLLADDNPRLTLKAYFAVTSNSVQFGAELDFLFKISKFKVVGFFYFHALFQFDPFYFNISIGAGLAVKLGSSTILEVSVSGSLEGPTPWKAKGKGKFKILFVSFSVSFSVTWGEEKDTSLPKIDVFPALDTAIRDNRSWLAVLPASNTLTTLRDIESDVLAEEEQDDLILHPFGSLSLQQRVVPLDMRIDLFGNQEPNDYNSFSLAFELQGNTLEDDDLKDFFAPSQFLDLNDDQKISKKAYEKYNAGIKAVSTDNLHANYRAQKEVRYELKVVDSPDHPPFVLEFATEFNHWARGSAIAKSPMGKEFDSSDKVKGKKVKFDQEAFVIAKKSDLTQYESFEGASELEVQRMLDNILVDNPEMEDELMIVPNYELV